jgi:PAS domain S-box-containing protein
LNRCRHRRKKDHAARQYDRQVRELVESINLLAVRLDQEGRITFCNDCLLDLTGWRRDEVYGKDWFDLFVPPDHTRLRQLFQAGIRTGVFPGSLQHDIVTRQGERRFIAWNNAILRDPSGRIAGTAGIGEDVTDRIHGEQALYFSQAQLKELVAELAFAEERERRRIATELHDGVAQSLAFAKFKINECLADSGSGDQKSSALSVRETLEDSIDEIRKLAFRLSPPFLHEAGIEAALEWLAEQFQQEHGFQVVMVSDHEPKPLAEDLAITIFQMARELLINVAKHAAATRVTITLIRKGGRLQLTVADDGCGMDPTRLNDRTRMPAGFGLFNIHQRLQFIRGEMILDSQPGTGTTIMLNTPLTDQETGRCR